MHPLLIDNTVLLSLRKKALQFVYTTSFDECKCFSNCSFLSWVSLQGGQVYFKYSSKWKCFLKSVNWLGYFIKQHLTSDLTNSNESLVQEVKCYILKSFGVFESLKWKSIKFFLELPYLEF